MIAIGAFETQVSQHQSCIVLICCPHHLLTADLENVVSPFSPLLNASRSDTNFLDQSTQHVPQFPETWISVHLSTLTLLLANPGNDSPITSHPPPAVEDPKTAFQVNHL